jgi:hypothetical protein
MEIIDNFLKDETYQKLKSEVWCENVNWFKRSVSDLGPQKIFFTHSIYVDYSKSYLFSIMEPIIKELKIKCLIRAKLNYYHATHEVLKHGEHRDYNYTHKAAILSFNTCDGGTLINDNFIESIDNRIILFDGSIKHNSFSSTSLEGRLNLSINYF